MNLSGLFTECSLFLALQKIMHWGVLTKIYYQ